MDIIMNTNAPLLIGAVAGDIIGSVYEWKNTKSMDFDLFPKLSRFTDDTVLTIALADCILNKKPITETFQEYGRNYKNAGFGGGFYKWIFAENPQPYNSFGNGSAMRVSPVGFAYNTEEEVLEQAKLSAEVSHNHPEGIKGAQSVAISIFMARTGKSKQEIKNYVTEKFGYNLNQTINEIRPEYKFDVSCQGSVPQAIIAFLESDNFEHAIRLAISIGGDSDTIACITGAIAHAFYNQIPQFIYENILNKLPDNFKDIIFEFDKQYKK